eukprot:4231374-Alexandrium_andersonii.AAC.1
MRLLCWRPRSWCEGSTPSSAIDSGRAMMTSKREGNATGVQLAISTPPLGLTNSAIYCPAPPG